jgi:hypothetical protein
MLCYIHLSRRNTLQWVTAGRSHSDVFYNVADTIAVKLISVTHTRVWDGR